MYLVVGSSPDVLLPGPGYKFTAIYGANGGARIAVDAGYERVNLVTHAGFANRPTINPEQQHLFDGWKDLDVDYVFIDETDGKAEQMRQFFLGLGLTHSHLVGIPYKKRGFIVKEVVGQDYGTGTDQTRVSSGVFAACLAFYHGAKHVILAGISLTGGHHGHGRPDARKHLVGDIAVLELLAKQGRVSTTSPALARKFGMPLVVSPENVQRVAYQQSTDTASESEACLRAAFDYLGIPLTMVDFGSGDGHLVDWASRHGVRAVGLDLYRPCAGMAGQFFAWDLGQPWPGGWGMDGADLVLCWETAEHLPKAGADALVDNVVAALGPKGRLLFTAATPGQGGSGHLNEQPHHYWIDKFLERGLQLLPSVSEDLKVLFKDAAPLAFWYSNNILVFERIPQ